MPGLFIEMHVLAVGWTLETHLNYFVLG